MAMTMGPLPGEDEEDAKSLYKFINGEPISREDCASVMMFLKENGHATNVPLLVKMQERHPQFTPVLDLRLNMNAAVPPDQTAVQNLTQLLFDAHDQGLKAMVQVDEDLPEGLAVVLKEVMVSPRSPIVAFCLVGKSSGQPNSPGFNAALEMLEQGITGATALQFISGPASVLKLIKRSVQELELSGLHFTFADQTELERVLNLGGVNKLVSRSLSEEMHELIAVALSKANQCLPPEKCVHEFEVVGSPRPEILNNRPVRNLVRALFAAKHLTKLTLPVVDWLATVPLFELTGMVAEHSLQELLFSKHYRLTRAGVTYLEGITAAIEKNRRSVLSWALAPASGFTAALSGHFLHDTGSSHEGAVVDELAARIAREAAQGLSAADLATINTTSGTVSRQTRDLLEKQQKPKET
jgi:hypothetical protein